VKLIEVKPDDLTLSPELSRSGSAKQFEERLQSSIEEIGLAEPLKVARQPGGGYLVIDGTMRLRAIRAIRDKDPSRFKTVAIYVLDYARRYEIRYQSDIYQDLLPSQLAILVEHLHKTENVLKVDIARYIGVSPATLRNYTGLWRLLERGGLFARVVELMDVGVFPSSNPYAWLRLTDSGLRKVLTEQFAKEKRIDRWITEAVDAARLGATQRYPVKYIEAVTDALPSDCYRVGEDVRAIKRDLGQRRATSVQAKPNVVHDFVVHDFKDAFKNLTKVTKQSTDPVLRTAARALQEYLQ
jgi:ParB-like chromosome segregation protein Spo0J